MVVAESSLREQQDRLILHERHPRFWWPTASEFLQHAVGEEKSRRHAVAATARPGRNAGRELNGQAELPRGILLEAPLRGDGLMTPWAEG